MPAFDNYRELAYPYVFKGVLEVGVICGGIPSDPRVAEAWLKTRMGLDNDATLMAAVATTMAEREVTLDEATALVNEQKHLNGFKRERCADCTGEYVCARKGAHRLFIEGRQLKAALKEAVSVAIAAGKVEQKGWGSTRKWLSTYFPEHVFVREEKLFLRVKDANGELVYVTEPTGVNQRFVHTHRGTGIQYEEFVQGAIVEFTVDSDHPFSTKDWAMIWTTGEKQGLGATRSQGYGTYTVQEWTEVGAPPKKTRKAAAATAPTATVEESTAMDIDELLDSLDIEDGEDGEPTFAAPSGVIESPVKVAKKVTAKRASAAIKVPAIATI